MTCLLLFCAVALALLLILNSISPVGHYSTYTHPWKTWVQTTSRGFRWLPPHWSFIRSSVIPLDLRNQGFYHSHLAWSVSLKYLSPIFDVFLMDCKFLAGTDYVFLTQHYPPTTLYSAWHTGEAHLMVNMHICSSIPKEYHLQHFSEILALFSLIYV